MGDWNSAPDSLELRFLQEIGCYDVIYKAPKKLRDRPTNTNHNNNRRIDRFYIHNLILNRHQIRYKIHSKPTRSSHFPVSICIKEKARRKQHKRNSHFPTAYYTNRNPPIPNHLLKNKEFVTLLFKPTTIWQEDPKLSFEYYTKTISERADRKSVV